jgi:pyruvate ferredoxin oxidoreductase delta subunit
MIKPKIQQYRQPCTISEYPVGPSFQAGHLVTTNSNYRSSKPIIDITLCVGCLACYVACPDGAIVRDGKKVRMDYDFCKGCGICASECKVKAIAMKKETQGENE